MPKVEILPPPEFRIDRSASVGRHRLSAVFEGLPDVAPFARYPGPAAANRDLARRAWVEVIGDPMWMYVAPHRAPPFARKVGWTPVVSSADCIVVGRGHLKNSPALELYLDVIHEFCHLIQRRAGRDLWDMSKGYVGSPTELQAYRFAVREARRLKATDAFLRKYLRVEWVSKEDHVRLLRALGVSAR
jgi:hypothetical protein